MRIGVIGTGNIGGLLARAFAEVKDLELLIFNRSPYKAEAIAVDYPHVRTSNKVQDLIASCDIVFLSTKADDGVRFLKEFGDQLSPFQVLAVTISAVPLAQFESLTPARVVKVIPSIVQTKRSGVMLLCYGHRFDRPQMDTFEAAIQAVATPFAVEESQIRVCSDLTSCGPAFIGSLLLIWSEAAAETGRISRAEAEHLLCQTLIGVSELLKSGVTLNDILRRVTVPGGVTEAGLKAVESVAPHLFYQLHHATQRHSHTPHEPIAETISTTL